jgi:GTP-binding protein
MPAVFLKSATELSQLPEGNKPHIAIVGRSNVGKSTLVNQLTRQIALARVSAKPGHTQAMNVYEVDKRYYLIDLPGFGYAKTSKTKRVDFQDMIADYLRATEQLKLVILIVDASIPPTTLDQEIFGFLESLQLPIVIVLNKVDKLSKNEITKMLPVMSSAFPNVAFVKHSSVQGIGRGELNEAIEKSLRV